MQHKPLQLNPYLTGETPHSMVERLQHLAQIQADKTALVVVSDKEGVLDERSFTYGELDIQIKSLAASTSSVISNKSALSNSMSGVPPCARNSAMSACRSLGSG